MEGVVSVGWRHVEDGGYLAGLGEGHASFVGGRGGGGGVVA